MKSTKFLFSLILTLLLTSCVPTKKITQKVISHTYYNVSFTPESIQKQGIGKMEITITPIDAASINRETFEAAKRDGNYEKELAIAIEKRKSEIKNLTRLERAILNGKINGIDAVSKLEKDNLIPTYTAYQLKMRIWHGEEYGKNGTEVTSLADIETFPDNFNQYRINQKYLSVFKVTFENNSDKIEKVKLKEFQIVSGEELLYPLEMEYFEKNLSEEPEKIKNAYRMNIPKELIITPSQKITKFLAIPAINPQNQALQVQLIRGSEIVNFEFAVKEQSLNKNYKVQSYDIAATGLADPYNQYYYYAINYQDGISFAITNQRIFVSEEKKNKLASLYAVAIHKTRSKARTSRLMNFKFAGHDKNKIIIPFESASKKRK